MSGIVMRTEKKSTSAIVRNAHCSVRQDRTEIPAQLKVHMKQRAESAFNHVPGHHNSDMPSRLDALAYTQEKPVEIGRSHQANESSDGKKVAIIQRMRNNVFQRCGSEQSKSSSKKNIESYEVTTYEDFRNRSIVGDDLEGHEMWQHANIKKKFSLNARLSAEVSKKNPVMALPKDVHKVVSSEQRTLNVQDQTPIENIEANAAILNRHSDIPKQQIEKQLKCAIQHYRNTTQGGNNE